MEPAVVTGREHAIDSSTPVRGSQAPGVNTEALHLKRNNPLTNVSETTGPPPHPVGASASNYILAFLFLLFTVYLPQPS